MADENPNPARITDASWRFMMALLDMEPNTENSGIYADKPGYHNRRDAVSLSDYSRRHPLDLLGPGDKAAAYDWTHRAAQSGNYISMVKYGKRLLAAFEARDPRLYGWAEAQGQTDLDSTPEELNFGPDWTRGTPSSSHAWHWHFSERRAFVASWDNKAAMLSVLSGQTLFSYIANGGKLMGDDEDMALSDTDAGILVARVDGLTYAKDNVSFGPQAGEPIPLVRLIKDTAAAVAELKGPAPVDPAALKAVLLDPEVLAAIAKAVNDDQHKRTAE